MFKHLFDLWRATLISSLTGEVLDVGNSSAVIETGGVGFSFFATPNTLSQLRLGTVARVFTALIVREDSLTLFGFNDCDEREVFQVLLSVSGIGAKTALAVLAVFSPDQLRLALNTKDEKAVCKVPGIGPKAAKRIILEIGDKLGKPHNATESVNLHPDGHYKGIAVQNIGNSTYTDLLSALVNLGWREREADTAINEALACNPDGSVPELLRLALQILGERR